MLTDQDKINYLYQQISSLSLILYNDELTQKMNLNSLPANAVTNALNANIAPNSNISKRIEFLQQEYDALVKATGLSPIITAPKS